MNDAAKIKDFKDLGLTASYHYADDSGKEWGLGRKAQDKALEIFDANPDLQEVMRGIATGFLWSLNMRRPNTNEESK